MSKHYHLIGIGGIGMSGIAQLFLCHGFKVSGSDLKENRATRQLKEVGAKIYIGHSPSNIIGADTVVYSSAIKEDNPEVAAARNKGIPVIMRAKALSELMKDKTVITVAGSHGKTTTTSLVSYMLLEAGLNPTVAIGGVLKNIETNACMGKGDLFIAEADESDGSFLYYNPKYSIITNIDREHLDYYKDFDKEVDAFREFVSKTSEDGCLFCCADDRTLRAILKDYNGRRLLFGLRADADVYPRNIRLKGLSSEFDCIYKGKPIGRFSLALGGEHNISNSLSVIALGLELGVSLEVIKKALPGYKGAGRRLEEKFYDSRYLVLDDYAHHPTEIRATLSAVKNLNRRRTIVVFQPHRYTRTQLLLDEFAKSFDYADYIIITDIYAASEQPIKGVDAASIVKEIKKYTPDKEAVFMAKDKVIEYTLDMLREGDLILVMGAGDIVKVGDELAEKLKIKS